MKRGSKKAAELGYLTTILTLLSNKYLLVSHLVSLSLKVLLLLGGSMTPLT